MPDGDEKVIHFHFLAASETVGIFDGHLREGKACPLGNVNLGGSADPGQMGTFKYRNMNNYDFFVISDILPFYNIKEKSVFLTSIIHLLIRLVTI